MDIFREGDGFSSDNNISQLKSKKGKTKSFILPYPLPLVPIQCVSHYLSFQFDIKWSMILENTTHSNTYFHSIIHLPFYLAPPTNSIQTLETRASSGYKGDVFVMNLSTFKPLWRMILTDDGDGMKLIY